MIGRNLLLGTFGVMLTSMLSAQTEPVDQNFEGPYAGGLASFGQALKVGDSAPGPVWLISGDLGYGIKRDTWNRIELGVELGTGGASFKDKNNGGIKVDLDLDMLMMLKGGYGYSLGGKTFGFLRAGAGMTKASYDGKLGGLKVDGGSSTGLVTMIGWDTVYFASDKLDLTLGFNFRFFNFDFSDIGDAGSFQMNVPTLFVGARFRL